VLNFFFCFFLYRCVMMLGCLLFFGPHFLPLFFTHTNTPNFKQRMVTIYNVRTPLCSSTQV